jgi:PAS domain S-box-containing protein
LPGALLTLSVIAVLTADERFLGPNVPNPGVVLALPVILATWTGGWRGALFSVTAGMCFILWKYALPGVWLSYTPEDAGRIVVIALVLPMIAATIAWLRIGVQLRTERAHSDTALREGADRLRLAVQAANIGLWDWDLQTDQVVYSREWKGQLGFDEEEIGADFREWERRVHPEDLDTTRRRVRSYLSDPAGSLETEFRMRHKDGSWRWIYARGELFRDDAGKAVRMLGCHVDITERKRAEEQVLGMNKVLRMIAADTDLPRTLEELLRVIEAEDAEMLSSILLLDADGARVRRGAAPRLPTAFMRAIDGQPIGPRAGSCGTAAFRREPVIVTDIGTDPLWEDYRELAAVHGLRACWSTPILDSAGTVLGTFAIYYREPRSPAPHHRRIVEVVTQTAAIAIESARHERDLRESRERLEALSHRLIDAQEEERRALARELHDEIGQVLTAVKLSLEAERLGAETEVRRARLTGCVELVDNAIRQVRDRSLDLRPSMLDDLGLIPTLQWYLEQRGRSDNCEIEFEADPLPFRPPPAVEITCYRVVQEAITNVLRHSQARHARVRVAAGERALELTVSDDGRGFDVNEARRRGVAGERFGLLGMEERVALAGGRMTITSAPGQGTEIRAALPYKGPQA